MLRLTLNGLDIPVSLDFSMRITWKSPATDFEKIPGGYGLGLSFPINEHTRAIFGNPERFSKSRSKNDQKFEGFEVRFSGMLLMAGTLSVTSAEKGEYSATLVDQVGVLGENERERDILTFSPFTKEIPWTNKANFNAETDPYCAFEVINPGFFKEKGVTKSMVVYENGIDEDGTHFYNRPTDEKYETEVLTYCFEQESMARVNKLDADNKIKQISSEISLLKNDAGYEYLTGRLTVVSPFFFLPKVIIEALKAVDFYIGFNALNSSENFRKLCIYHNFDITKTDYTKSHVDARTEIDRFTGQYVHYGAKDIQAYIRSYPQMIKPKDCLPAMKLGDLLLSTQNLLNVCFHFLPDNTVNIYLREALITGASMDLNDYFLGKWDIGEKVDVALNFTHENDGNDLVFGERFQDISDRISDRKEPVADWEELLAVEAYEGDIRWMTSTNCYFEYKWITRNVDAENTKDMLGWEEFSIGFQSGWYNRGKREVEEIKTSWSTCYGTNALTLVNQQGNMNGWRAKYQAFSPRLLLYKGNNSGGNESADFSLDYEKAGKGILPTCWKHWNPFWANRLPVTGMFDLPLNVLRHLIYNICSKYRTREGEFMIDEMSCDIYVGRIGETEIKGFKVE